MKAKFALLLSLFIAVVIFGTVLAASAATTSTSGGVVSIQLPNPLKLNGCTAGQSDLECLVNQIVNTLIIIAFPIATLLIIWGAFQLMSAGGNVEKIEKGWTTIRYTVLGFVVILLASLVVSLVQGIFTSVTSDTSQSSGGGGPPVNCPGSAGCSECNGVNPPAYCGPSSSGSNCSDIDPAGSCPSGLNCLYSAGHYACGNL